MSSEEQRIELIEKYYFSQLSGQEKVQFENLLKNEPAFKKELEEYKLLFAGIREAGRDNLRRKIKEQMNTMKKKEPPRRLFTIRFSYAIAATIAVVIIASMIFITQRDGDNILANVPTIESYYDSLATVYLAGAASLMDTDDDAFGFVEVEEDTIDFSDERLASLFDQAMKKFDQHDYQAGIKPLLEISKKFDHPHVYFKIGEAYMRLEEYDDAIKFFTKCIDLDFKNTMGYTNKGYCLQKQNKHNAAIKNYKLAVHYDSTNYIAHYNMGLARWWNQDIEPEHRRDIEKAVIDFTNSIRHQPMDTKFDSAYYARGIGYNRLGYLENAVEDFASAIELRPERAATYFHKGMSHFYLQEYRESRDLFTKARAFGYRDENLQKYLDWAEQIIKEQEDQAKK